MKPTIQQVVAHFGLPDEALESEEIEMAIDASYPVPDHFDQMKVIEWKFVARWGCPITDWFKPNDGMD